MQMVSLHEPATGIIDPEWVMHQASCVSVTKSSGAGTEEKRSEAVP